MTTKQIKQGLVGGSAALLLGAVVVLAWGVLVPVRVDVPAPSVAKLPDKPLDGGNSLAGALPTPDALSALGAIDLRRPLKDPPPVVVTPPPLAAQLRGTIYESANPDQSMAMFKLQDGSERWFRAGQQFDDPVGKVMINRVGDQRVTVTYRGKERELVAEAQ